MARLRFADMDNQMSTVGNRVDARDLIRSLFDRAAGDARSGGALGNNLSDAIGGPIKSPPQNDRILSSGGLTSSE